MPQGAGYWISPSNVLVRVAENHIKTVLNHPEQFGYAPGQVEDIYAHHDEKVGTEGEAREQVIKDLVSRRWIRIREYQGRGREYISVFFRRMDKYTKEQVASFFRKYVDKEIPAPLGKFADVRLVGLTDNYSNMFSASRLAQDVLYTESRQEPPGKRLVLESIHESEWTPVRQRVREILASTLTEDKAQTDRLVKAGLKLLNNFYDVDYGYGFFNDETGEVHWVVGDGAWDKGLEEYGTELFMAVRDVKKVTFADEYSPSGHRDPGSRWKMFKPKDKLTAADRKKLVAHYDRTR